MGVPTNRKGERPLAAALLFCLLGLTRTMLFLVTHSTHLPVKIRDVQSVAEPCSIMWNKGPPPCRRMSRAVGQSFVFDWSGGNWKYYRFDNYVKIEVSTADHSPSTADQTPKTKVVSLEVVCVFLEVRLFSLRQTQVRSKYCFQQNVGNNVLYYFGVCGFWSAVDGGWSTLCGIFT